MEQNTATNPASKVNFMLWLKIIGLAAIAIAIIGVLKKFGLFKKSEADKLQDAQDAKDKQGAIELQQSKALKVQTLTDFLNNGLGKSEYINQYPFTSKQEADMVEKIHKAHTMIGHGDGAEAISVLSFLPTKFSINNIAYSFQIAYGQDMLSYLQKNVNDAGLARINEIINSKPDFKPLLPASAKLLKDRNQTLTL